MKEVLSTKGTLATYGLKQIEMALEMGAVDHLLVSEDFEKMPNVEKFKSVSVSKDTHNKLNSLAKNRFEVPVSVQKVIEFLLEQEMKNKRRKNK